MKLPIILPAQCKPLISKYEHENKLLCHLAKMLTKKTDIANYLSDLINNGCTSGVEGTMIYYADTEAFAKKFLTEILELMADVEEETGMPVRPMNDESITTNWLAWFGFEEGMRRLGQELGLDI